VKLRLASDRIDQLVQRSRLELQLVLLVEPRREANDV
jgi:hypothetical protein